jgi:hypothetical protein
MKKTTTNPLLREMTNPLLLEMTLEKTYHIGRVIWRICT